MRVGVLEGGEVRGRGEGNVQRCTARWGGEELEVGDDSDEWTPPGSETEREKERGVEAVWAGVGHLGRLDCTRKEERRWRGSGLGWKGKKRKRGRKFCFVLFFTNII